MFSVPLFRCSPGLFTCGGVSSFVFRLRSRSPLGRCGSLSVGVFSAPKSRNRRNTQAKSFICNSLTRSVHCAERLERTPFRPWISPELPPMSSVLDRIRGADSTTPASTATAPPAFAPVAAAAPPATSASPAGPCAACGCRRFWRDPYGAVRCESCQPAKIPVMVKARITISEAGEVAESNPAATAAPQALPPAEPCRKCGHARFRFFGEKFFCEKCEKKSHPSDSAGRLFCVLPHFGYASSYWQAADALEGTLVSETLTPDEQDYFDGLRLKAIRAAEDGRRREEEARQPAGKKTPGRSGRRR